MKKIQSMMLMLLVAVMGMCVQSCTKEETTTIGYVYSRQPLTELLYNDKAMTSMTEEDILADQTLAAFGIALQAADNSAKQLVGASGDAFMNIYKNAFASFTSGKGFEGYILFTKSKLGSDYQEELGKITFTK